ncbi:MAG TPA: hypothetical protein VHX65_09045 [Pirellulales bacterium]|jgi:hypothetical protein|nr:hypothetical protein [Pirellulales bacterium]
MICILKVPTPEQLEPEETDPQATAEEPRAVGQLMAAVLQRYGISADAELFRPTSRARSRGKGVGAHAGC